MKVWFQLDREGVTKNSVQCYALQRTSTVNQDFKYQSVFFFPYIDIMAYL